MEILLVLAFVMGLALGLGLKKRSVSQLKVEMVEALDLIEEALGRDLERWTEMARQLELKYQKERERSKSLESDLRWERVQRMHPKKKLDYKK